MANHVSHSSDNGHSTDAQARGSDAPDSQTAIDLIRSKLDQMYASEPEADEEMTEAQHLSHRSKHQQFMYELGASGKDLATIQTEWHAYYQSLSSQEKHQVWREFYDSQSQLTHQVQTQSPTEKTRRLVQNKQKAAQSSRQRSPKLRNVRSTQDIQHVIRHNVTAGGKLGVKHQLQSLLFGFGIGLLVIFVFMFGFFNEVFIAPFIQPSRVQADTPLIVNATSVAPTPNPEVIIPKINVQIPVDYSETSTNESVIEDDLEGGVVHYPTTVLPGQDGNAAFFGHSSNNIFNQGKYKFAFVLLHTLVNGDTFYLTYNDKIYVYKVISHTVVSPSDVGVLGPISGQTATATLITCDPPGTSINRLIVVGQQISPDPSGNTQPVPTTNPTTLPTQLPGNGQTLWGRFISTTIGKLIVTFIAGGVIIFFLRKLQRHVSHVVP